jgi:DNA-binding NarL/FixJ family response regulator
MTLLIAIISIVVLLLVLYLANIKLEFRLTKSIGDKEIEKNNLDKLSNTELTILKLVSEGKTNQEIADQLFISVHTVKKHISNIFKKLNISSRSQTRKFKDQIMI